MAVCALTFTSCAKTSLTSHLLLKLCVVSCWRELLNSQTGREQYRGRVKRLDRRGGWSASYSQCGLTHARHCLRDKLVEGIVTFYVARQNEFWHLHLTFPSLKRICRGRGDLRFWELRHLW